jgi:hypothetical protein
MNMFQRVILLLFCVTIIIICSFFIPFRFNEYNGQRVLEYFGYDSLFAPRLGHVETPRLAAELVISILFWGAAFFAFKGEIRK